MQKLISDSPFFWLEKSMIIHLPGPRPKKYGSLLINLTFIFHLKLVLFLTFIKSFSVFGSFVGDNLT